MYEELIKDLQYCAQDKVETCEVCPYLGSRTGFCSDVMRKDAAAALEDMNRKIEQLTAERDAKWISVKDRLPEDDLPQDSKRKNIKVLATVSKNGKNSIRTLCRERWIMSFNPTVYHEWIWSKDARGITHWMPLPEPPKEDVCTKN